MTTVTRIHTEVFVFQRKYSELQALSDYVTALGQGQNRVVIQSHIGPQVFNLDTSSM